MEILMDLHVLRTPESENQYFSGFVCGGVCLCASVTSVTKKQITAKTSNLAFYICITCRCYLKLLMKIRQIVSVQGHTKEF